MADKEINITGSQRAAILMLGLGESLAAELMKHMLEEHDAAKLVAALLTEVAGLVT